MGDIVMIRFKLRNSSLHNVSNKRLEQIATGKYKARAPKPLAKVNKESARLWAQARRDCFKKYGRKCFLCGATDCEIHIHHFEQTRQQCPARKYDITNLVPLCQRCHNHHGADKRFYELKSLIFNKLQRQEYDTQEF